MPEHPVPRRPRFDPGGPITGLFFLAVAGIFLGAGFSGRSLGGPGVLIPAILIGLGVVGTIRVLTRSRRRNLR